MHTLLHLFRSITFYKYASDATRLRLRIFIPLECRGGTDHRGGERAGAPHLNTSMGTVRERKREEARTLADRAVKVAIRDREHMHEWRSGNVFLHA